MHPSTSDVWHLPSWTFANSGPYDLIPSRATPKTAVRPKTRPTLVPPAPEKTGHLEAILTSDSTMRALPDFKQMPTLASLGIVKRASPPPDAMRLFSSFALLFTLFFALLISNLLGG